MTQGNAQDPSIIIETGAHPDAAVIWMHGLGADGHDFESIVPALELPAPTSIRFIFPNAPIRPVTLNNGMPMRAWYDIKSLGGSGPEDEEGIQTSAAMVNTLIDEQISAGIPAERIVVAGFSQGGAIALYTGARSARKLGGIMALSTYLVLSGKLTDEHTESSTDIPVLMIHGIHDQVVPLDRGRQARLALEALDYQVQWHDYPMAHEVCMPEVQEISAWLQRVL